LLRDNVATQILARWYADAALFRDDQANGPVPLLFAANPVEASEAILAEPSKAHFDLNKVWGTFVAFEAVTPGEARELIKHPRYI
jgi:hypothetical protein